MSNEAKMRVWCDIGFAGVLTLREEYYVEFAIYQVLAESAGAPLFQRRDAESWVEMVETIEESEVYAHGSVKWDGCSNWTIDENHRGVCLHSCDRAGLLHLGEAMARCWDWSRELIGRKRL